MLIGLNGFKGAGKDTVAQYLVRKHGFVRMAFADALKTSVSELFDIGAWEVDELKVQDNVYVAIGYKNEPEEKFEGQPSKMWSPIKELTMREFLQRYGTEAHRDVFKYDFWVDVILPDPEIIHEADTFHRGRKFCISDVRFPNELQRIVDLGGFNLRINRPGIASDGHVSEEIPSPELIFATIDNGADYYYLEEQIEQALDKIIADEKVHGWRSEGDM